MGLYKICKVRMRVAQVKDLGFIDMSYYCTFADELDFKLDHCRCCLDKDDGLQSFQLTEFPYLFFSRQYPP